MRISEDANSFAKHIIDIHDDVRCKIAISNESYKAHADMRRSYA